MRRFAQIGGFRGNFSYGVFTFVICRRKYRTILQPRLTLSAKRKRGKHSSNPLERTSLVPKLQFGNPRLPANRHESLGSKAGAWEPGCGNRRVRRMLTKRGTQPTASLALRASVTSPKTDELGLGRYIYNTRSRESGRIWQYRQTHPPAVSRLRKPHSGIWPICNRRVTRGLTAGGECHLDGWPRNVPPLEDEDFTLFACRSQERMPIRRASPAPRFSEQIGRATRNGRCQVAWTCFLQRLRCSGKKAPMLPCHDSRFLSNMEVCEIPCPCTLSLY